MTFRAAFYKVNHPGLAGLYSRFVRWWTKSPYSHCEFIFSDGMAASSSFLDGGVRFKKIDFDFVHWDFVEIDPELENSARAWFMRHDGDGYDVLGNIHFLIGAVPDSKSKWFCSESMAAAIGIAEPWRLDPHTLRNVLKWNAANKIYKGK